MQSANVRDVQHHLSRLLQRVEQGEEFEVLRRKHPVAKIVPIKSSNREETADWSSHAEEIEHIFGGEEVGGKLSEHVVIEGRGRE